MGQNPSPSLMKCYTWSTIHLPPDGHIQAGRRGQFLLDPSHIPRGFYPGLRFPNCCAQNRTLCNKKAGVARAVCFNFGGGSQNPAPVKMSIQHIQVCMIDSDHAARKECKGKWHPVYHSIYHLKIQTSTRFNNPILFPVPPWWICWVVLSAVPSLWPSRVGSSLKISW